VLLLRYESVGWVTEILDAATAADTRQLPRLYSAATFCSQLGQTGAAVDYAHTALALATDARYDPLEPAWTCGVAGTANVYAARMEEALGVTVGLVGQPGVANVIGLMYMLLVLPVVGRADEARALADEALSASRACGIPNLVSGVLSGYGRAFAATDPIRALDALREGVVYTRQHRLVYFEALLCREAGGLEAVHGDPGQALALLENAIDLLQRSGEVGNLSVAFAELAVLFDRLQQPEIAATLYGASRRHGDIGWVTRLASVIDHLRTVLGDITFDHCLEMGAAMEINDAATYARRQIRLTHPPPIEPPQPPPASTNKSTAFR
jgi:hypothetical protein